MRRTVPTWLTLAVLTAFPVLSLACGAAEEHGKGSSGGESAGGAGQQATTANGFGQSGTAGQGDIQSITIDPPTAMIDVDDGVPGTQTFTATAHYADGSTSPLSGASWSNTSPSVGSVDGSGVFTANGSLGGVLTVKVNSGMASGTAELTVKLHVTLNPDGLDAATQTGLQQATDPDGTVTWAYPYDGIVYPRGIGGPPLMWMNGAASDDYLVHVTSSTFDLQIFATNLASRYDFDPALWTQFSESTGGSTELKVARGAGGAFSVVADHHDIVAPASMRGTIYYWAINTGRVMRIKPGSAAPDDFIGPSITCPSCHTASANGSRLIMNEGSWPHEDSISYDLLGQTNSFSGLHTDGGASQWALAGISADGSVLVQNFAPLRGAIGQQVGAFDAVTSDPIAGSGLDKPLLMPAFSPDDQLLAYVDQATGDLRAYDWNATTKQASNDRVIMAAGPDNATKIINGPTVSPDHQWIIYQRSNTNGSLGNAANLFIASVANPGTELPLANLNGATYPFAAGDRDRNLSFEPTFAPVAAGGYFWVVFHSRRTFGNALTGNAYNGEGSGTKQLWVAAIDQAPTAGVDPSHPAFWLPGQDITTLNMRGYWALDPCKQDGNDCESGTECCGGFCDTTTDPPQCKSSTSGCSHSGDACTSPSDCCDPGASCINDVCSEPPPQ